jgi:hypothetical protein
MRPRASRRPRDPCRTALDTVLGALTGAAGELIGIGFLGALSFVLLVAAL